MRRFDQLGCFVQLVLTLATGALLIACDWSPLVATAAGIGAGMVLTWLIALGLALRERRRVRTAAPGCPPPGPSDGRTPAV